MYVLIEVRKLHLKTVRKKDSTIKTEGLEEFFRTSVEVKLTRNLKVLVHLLLHTMTIHIKLTSFLIFLSTAILILMKHKSSELG